MPGPDDQPQEQISPAVAPPAPAEGLATAPAESAPITPPASNSLKDVEVEGYKFQFDADKIDDVEVIEMASQIEKGDAAKIIDFIKFLLGDDGYTEMKNYFVTKDGKFKLTTLMNVFEQIFENFDPKALA